MLIFNKFDIDNEIRRIFEDKVDVFFSLQKPEDGLKLGSVEVCRALGCKHPTKTFIGKAYTSIQTIVSLHNFMLLRQCQLHRD